MWSMVKWHPAEDRYTQQGVLFLSFNVIALVAGPWFLFNIRDPCCVQKFSY
jgi:hypothetical protein